MGLTEFEALAAPPDWWLLRQLGPRAAVVAAPNDVWFKVRARCGAPTDACLPRPEHSCWWPGAALRRHVPSALPLRCTADLEV